MSDTGYTSVELVESLLVTSSELQVSPLKLRPAELVQGHFFEPAIVVHNGTDIPYLGTGHARVNRVKGSYRIVLHRHNVDLTIWWVIGAGEPPLTTRVHGSFTKNFSDIEYSLSNCVQACLATEPVLAVCLSISHRFDVKDEFQTTFGKLWQETLPQRTRGQVDGELNEYAVFAALQLACRTYTYPTTLSVKEMLLKLCSLLRVEPDGIVRTLIARENANGNQNVVLESPAAPKKVEIVLVEGIVIEEIRKPRRKKNKKKRLVTEIQKPKTRQELINDALAETMPWLVPACSRADLENTVHRAGAELFGGAEIAGLVPGATNSLFDAYAYEWADTAPLQWAFEFKARSANYTATDAIGELHRKCDTYRRIEDENGRTPEEFHAMLVGISGAGPTKILVWLEGTNRLRIVLLLNCKA
jgi:hypothetical protein